MDAISDMRTVGILAEYCQSLITKMFRCTEALIKAKGGPSKYHFILKLIEILKTAFNKFDALK